MLNKKILAAAVAAGMTSSAFAIDLTDPSSQVVTYASESVTAGADGRFVATNNTNLLDIDTVLGFTIGNGTNKYVRFDLTGAVFESPVTTGMLVITDVLTAGATAAPTAAISQGGAAGDDFVIIEITGAVADSAADDTVAFDLPDVDVSASGQSSVAYALYETAADAVNETTPLYSKSGVFTTVASANSGDFVTATTATATVASQFTDYTAPGAGLGEVGLIDGDQLLKTDITYYIPGGTAATLADVATTPQDVTIAGDFSFGDSWFLHTLAACAGGASITLTINEDENEATTDATVAMGTDYYLCNNNATAEDTIQKGSYVATLDTDGTSNTLGTIVYDTTSIEIRYLTTFSGYNQRIYIINNGSTDANYSTTFLGEAGVTATAGSMATGTVPAGEMKAIKAVDLVTLTGGTRTSATIEIEAQASDIVATSQTVNKSTGGTDTVLLEDN